MTFISWNLMLDASDNFEKKKRDLNRTFLHFLQSCNRLWKSALEKFVEGNQNNRKCLESWNVEICDGIRDSWIKCLKWSDQSNFSVFELKVCLSSNFAQIKHFYIVHFPSKSKDKDTKIHSAGKSYFRKVIDWDSVLLVLIVILSAKSWIFWQMSFNTDYL